MKILAAILFLISSCSSLPPQVKDKNFFHCEDSKQCMVIDGHCGEIVAIDSRHHDSYRSYNKKRSAVLTCSNFIKYMHDKDDFRALCKKQRCEISRI